MSPDLERLIKLQQLETTMEEARRTIGAHPQRLAAADARITEATQALEETKQKLKANHDARRAFEKDAAVFQGRLTRFKDQLSEVKTNREYQAMQKEIEVAEGELRAVEDRVLERMLEADALTAQSKTAEAALAKQQKEVAAEKKMLADELAATERALEQAKTARASLIAEIDARYVALFEHIAKNRKGIAVCPAADGLCTICHVRLRPQVFQEIKRNDSIIQCDSCQRILYYVPPASAAQPTAANT